MSSDYPDFAINIPAYLTEGEERLKKELESFAVDDHVGHYYGAPSHDGEGDALFQGDGVVGVKVYDYNSGGLKTIKALVVSNTCDISLENKRDLPPYVTVAPLVDLEAYEKLLLASGIGPLRVEGKMRAFRKQEVTNMFYLPGGHDGKEYVAILERAQSLPLSQVLEGYEHLFSLSLYGFYLFLFKLSIHFCRFQEGLSRPSLAD